MRFGKRFQGTKYALIPLMRYSLSAFIAVFCHCVFASWLNAAVIDYTATLSSAGEGPTVISSGTGFAEVVINTVAQTMNVSVTFSGLTSGTTASHIHATTSSPFTGNAGVATSVPYFPGFPLNVTSGTYSMLFDLTSASTYNPSFVSANGGTVAGAEAALEAALMNGEAYLNIHTSNYPGGEIRGFLVAPEISYTGSLLSATMLVGFYIRHRLARKERFELP